MMTAETEILETLEETEFLDAPAPAETVPEEEADLSRVPRRAPPRRGDCRRCGQDKPLNRLMLCYPCWVKTVLESRGWREGMPHPGWCDCVLPEHARKSDGN